MDEIELIDVETETMHTGTTADNVIALAAIAVMVGSTGYVMAKVGMAVGNGIGTGMRRVRDHYKK